MKLDYLAIGAHPDDVEIGCGATLAKLTAAGKKVGILDLTRGEMGSRGTPEIRKQEAENAAKILQVEFRNNLEYPDGFLENIKEYQIPIVQYLRKYRPEVVFLNAPEDRHPDHAKSNKLCSDACFLAGLQALKTQLDGVTQEPWRPKKVFSYIQWRDLKPDFVVVVDDFIEKKLESCMAYASQFYNPEDTTQETPISSLNFKESLRYRARNFGRLTGTEYAEGFIAEEILVVIDFDCFLL